MGLIPCQHFICSHICKFWISLWTFNIYQ